MFKKKRQSLICELWINCTWSVNITRTEIPYAISTISISELASAVNKFTTFSVCSVSQHLICDTGAKIRLWSTDWLVKKPGTRHSCPVSPSCRPFQFVGKSVYATHLAYLIAKLFDYAGKVHYFHQGFFVLPQTSIKFLVKLDSARNLAFDVRHCEGKDSHLFVTT